MLKVILVFILLVCKIVVFELFHKYCGRTSVCPLAGCGMHFRNNFNHLWNWDTIISTAIITLKVRYCGRLTGLVLTLAAIAYRYVISLDCDEQ